jgi:glycosyltransferase involved in cell wall biosynthesis
MIKDIPNIKYIPMPLDDRHHEAKKYLYQKAKAFLFPLQFEESFGLVSIEALSAGTPILTLNMGAQKEIVEHGKTGFVANNLDELSRCIEEVDDLKPEDCRKAAVERFDRKVMAKNYMKLYKEVLDGAIW